MNISDVNSHIERTNSLLSKLTLLLLGCGFLLFLVILGVIANITVCTILTQRRRYKKHLSNFMLFHLSITDIAYRLIVVPGQLIASLLPIQNKNVLICKVTKTLLFSVHTAVFTSLVVIALDRHQSITKPFQRLGRKPRFYLYVMAVWGYSILIASPQMYSEGIGRVFNITFPGKKDVNDTFSLNYCSPTQGSTQRILATAVYFILGFLIPLVIITVAYSKIAFYLWRKSRKRSTNQAALKSKGRALQMLVLLVLGFVVCLGVPQVKDLINSFGFDDLFFSLLATALQLSSSVINTVIYGIYSSEFKRGLLNRD